MQQQPNAGPFYPPAGSDPNNPYPQVGAYPPGPYPPGPNPQAGGPYPPMPPLGPQQGAGFSQPGAPPPQYFKPPGQTYQPHYDMPSTAAYNNPWAGGGPTGSGVIHPDIENQVLQNFAEKAVRRGFMRKVFGIVAVQLAITVIFSFICFFVTPIKDYVRANSWPFYMSWGLSFGLLLVISCNERLRRKYPVNMIFLALFTFAEAFLVGMITSFFNIEVVALAFLCTCVAVGVLALIACQSKIDITSWGTFLLIPSVLLILLVLVGVFWINRIYYLVISGVGALLASVYIVYDLQLIMGGKQFAISPDEYIFAALSLYLDIVQLFIWLLYLIGFSSNSN